MYNQWPPWDWPSSRSFSTKSVKTLRSLYVTYLSSKKTADDETDTCPNMSSALITIEIEQHPWSRCNPIHETPCDKIYKPAHIKPPLHSYKSRSWPAVVCKHSEQYLLNMYFVMLIQCVLRSHNIFYLFKHLIHTFTNQTKMALWHFVVVDFFSKHTWVVII